ncbi:hypothetical protein M9H77_06366 [Catharanthus roseus]|uniref:Uncharacterized protein n=1 Tax=Catharanthus roseus TaxID=4058 RepID=A0ACC0BS37_CATRO|nr:hypothetical protein M9H77_06366 [Catharanthus roseus]
MPKCMSVMESFQSSNRTVPDSIVSSIGEPEPISRNAPDCSAAKFFSGSRVYTHYCPWRKLKEGIIVLTSEKAVKEDGEIVKNQSCAHNYCCVHDMQLLMFISHAIISCQ